MNIMFYYMFYVLCDCEISSISGWRKQIWLVCTLRHTYNAILFLFAHFYVNAHARSNFFHLRDISFSKALNHTLVLTVCIKLAKKQLTLLMNGRKQI